MKIGEKNVQRVEVVLEQTNKQESRPVFPCKLVSIEGYDFYELFRVLCDTGNILLLHVSQMSQAFLKFASCGKVAAIVLR